MIIKPWGFIPQTKELGTSDFDKRQFYIQN